MELGLPPSAQMFSDFFGSLSFIPSDVFVNWSLSGQELRIVPVSGSLSGLLAFLHFHVCCCTRPRAICHRADDERDAAAALKAELTQDAPLLCLSFESERVPHVMASKKSGSLPLGSWYRQGSWYSWYMPKNVSI